MKTGRAMFAALLALSACGDPESSRVDVRAGDELVFPLGHRSAPPLLPAGMTATGGVLVWTPADEQRGLWTIVLDEEGAGHVVTMNVEPGSAAGGPVSFGGCDCRQIPEPYPRSEATAGAGITALAAAWCLRRRYRA